MIDLTSKNRDFSYREFETLYKKSFAKAVYYSKQYIGDYNQAQEIVQESFINLWEKRNKIDVINGNPEYYLLTIVRNLSLNYLRNRSRDTQRTNNISIDDNINMMLLSHEPDDLVLCSELSKAIKSTISSMSQKIRDVYILSRDFEMSNNQISEKLNISVKTVEYRLSKAMALFKKKLARFMTLLFFLIVYRNIFFGFIIYFNLKILFLFLGNSGNLVY